MIVRVKNHDEIAELNEKELHEQIELIKSLNRLNQIPYQSYKEYLAYFDRLYRERERRMRGELLKAYEKLILYEKRIKSI